MRSSSRAKPCDAIHPFCKLLIVMWATVWCLLVYVGGRRLLTLGMIAFLVWPVPLAIGRPAVQPPGVRVGTRGPSSTTHTRPTLAPAGPSLARSGSVVRPPPHGASGCPEEGLRRPLSPCAAPVRVAERSNPDGLLAAPPSVSAQAIWQALAAAGSPLANNGPRRAGRTLAEYLWARGAMTGIDPAVAMALFWHESHYGTLGIAVLTHSLTNMRPAGTQPARCGADGCYAYEADWFAGIDNMYALLQRYRRLGFVTVDQLIPVWAPPNDGNDVGAFMASVRETMYSLYTLSQKHAP
jgi:hypothetical protein